MPQEHEFNVFGIVMSTVCIPFFFLIGSLNTTQGMKFWRSKYHRVIAWLFSKNKNKKEKEDKSDDEDEDCEREVPGTFVLSLVCFK